MLIPIQQVDIELTMRDGSTEMFSLEAPNGEDPYRFGFSKLAMLGDYRDGDLNLQRGSYFFQFLADYDYVSHQMDLRKLLVASSIQLRFPPKFSATPLIDYQTTTVAFENPQVVKNYLAGFAAGTTEGEAVPSGTAQLRFIGTEPLTSLQVNQFVWLQGDVSFFLDFDFTGISPTTNQSVKYHYELGGINHLGTSVAVDPPGVDSGGDQSLSTMLPNGYQFYETSFFDSPNWKYGRVLLDDEQSLVSSPVIVTEPLSFLSAHTVDKDNNIYLWWVDGSAVKMVKYNSQFQQVFEVTVPTLTDSNFRVGRCSIIGDRVIALVRQASGTMTLRSFNTETGEQIQSVGAPAGAAASELGFFTPYFNDQFIITTGTITGNNRQINIYNHDLELQQTLNFADFTGDVSGLTNFNTLSLESTPEGLLIVQDRNNRLAVLNIETHTVLYRRTIGLPDGSATAQPEFNCLNVDTMGRVLTSYRMFSQPRVTLYEYLTDNVLVTHVISELGASSRLHNVRTHYTDWQRDYFKAIGQ